MDRSISPDLHWCYRLYSKTRRAQRTETWSDQSDRPDVYTEQRISSAEQSLRQCVDEWCERLRHAPDLILPVIERLASESNQVDAAYIVHNTKNNSVVITV